MTDYSSDWDRLRRRVYKRDSYTCQRCGRRGGSRGDATLHAHHRVAKADGGVDEISNLVTLCGRCHTGEHDSAYLEAAARRRDGDRGRRGRRRSTRSGRSRGRGR